jgi:glycosyltransferase involved in cell wall biosynthesis
MWNNRKVSVVLPAYNEAEQIAASVQGFLRTGYVDEVVVVDNNSTDGTADAVRQTAARLVSDTRQGYGYACRRALAEATGDLVVLSEPDGTFEPRDLIKLLSYADDFDVVLGTRTTAELIHRGANMDFALKWGNWAVAKFLEFLFTGPSLTDVGCTMRLIHRTALSRMQPYFSVGTSHFSPEIMILALVLRLRVVEIPLNYHERRGVSKITGNRVRAVRVGLAMIGLILRYRFGWWRIERRGCTSA